MSGIRNGNTAHDERTPLLNNSAAGTSPSSGLAATKPSRTTGSGPGYDALRQAEEDGRVPTEEEIAAVEQAAQESAFAASEFTVRASETLGNRNTLCVLPY